MQLEGTGVKTIGCGVSFHVFLSLAATVVACACCLCSSITPTSLMGKAGFAVPSGSGKKIDSQWIERGKEIFACEDMWNLSQ